MPQGHNAFLEELDAVGQRIPWNHPDRKIAYHNARAQICLYDEVYELRLAINRANGELDSASSMIQSAIETSGENLQTAGWVVKEGIDDATSALNRASDLISFSIATATKAINNASEQSTALGKKVVALNWLLAIVGGIGLLYGGLEISFKLYDRFYAQPPVKAHVLVDEIPKKAPPKLEKATPPAPKPEAAAPPKPAGKK